ncbi:MAG: NAD(P)/FAD-dependent oxidoreductase [Planctomycetota bacterium]|nr:NAD(P)/FAD-dependent oxidoreductase [Planctomycetota bacterium]
MSTANDSSHPVVVVGAGMAGLACARTLDEMGLEPLILEASDRVGGRVGSRRIDGFSCDLGFQVSMSNYVALERFVPRDEVPRYPFISGAVVVESSGRCPIIDPRRAPLASLRPWLKGLVGLRDLRSVARCRALAKRPSAPWEGLTTRELIDELGFSTRFRESFLRPFFGGVLLDDPLTAPASRFLQAFNRFAHGVAELPAGGMQALPDAMAAPLGDRIRLNSAVKSLDGTTLILHDGSLIRAQEIVLALPWPAIRALLGLEADGARERWFGTMAMHFSSTDPPSPARLIHLNARKTGWLNLACCPSQVAPGIAPEGAESIIASFRTGTVPDEAVRDPDDFADRIRHEVGALLELPAGVLRHLATDVIPEALPARTFKPDLRTLPAGVHLAGDWFANPSIDDAIESGIAAARRVHVRPV